MEMVWDWKSIGSLVATIMFLRTAVRDYLPAEVRHFLRSIFTRLYSSLRPTATIIIDENDSSGGFNELFEDAQTYLSSRCLSSSPVIRLTKPCHSKSLTSSLPSSHSATDSFRGISLRWSFQSLGRPSSTSFSRSSTNEHRFFELSFHRRHRAEVHSHYIPHLLDEAARIRLKSRQRRLYSNRSFASSSGDDLHGNRLWSSVPFNHPSTFDTLAIDPALSDSIRSDLLRFSARRDYYAGVGRAWKRGYLLHGPPGTGKTSLIAAISNFLEFDVYDLELTSVSSNSHLRKLLVSTSAKSIVVVEDVDCSLDLSHRIKKKSPEQESEGGTPTAAPFSTLSLSGVLNFVDGLWSSCVGERLMIFTTNYPDRIDPALLRPGRMDRRIELSYCEPAAFRVLAKNYLEVGEGHEMMAEAEGLLRDVRVTPADVAEVLMGCDGGGADVGMRKVVEELRRRKKGE